MLTRRAFAAASLAPWVAPLVSSVPVHAQDEANYDESRVPAYELPLLLADRQGRPIRDAAAWRAHRPTLVRAFEDTLYGATPTGLPDAHVAPLEEPVEVLEGRAWRQRIRLAWPGGFSAEMLVHRPRGERPVPYFVGLNYFGNHAVVADPRIPLSTRWMRASDAAGIVNHRATERSRGVMARRWPLDLIIGAGCGVVTAYYGDFAPDAPDVVRDGIAPLARERQSSAQWGAIGMWAWGLSQMRRAAATLPGLDARRAIVIGHSRLGKAALWAGAQDEAFAMVVSNDSGCAGAALSRRQYGETIERITRAFPHWFRPDAARWARREAEMPVDQHQLLALVAPRLLHVASAVDDRWADPRGEFLAARHASPAWTLFGKAGVGVSEMPGVDRAVGADVRYHVRTGGHDITAVDWAHYLETVAQRVLI